jgi:hypothetical protein
MPMTVTHVCFVAKTLAACGLVGIAFTHRSSNSKPNNWLYILCRASAGTIQLFKCVLANFKEDRRLFYSILFALRINVRGASSMT